MKWLIDIAELVGLGSMFVGLWWIRPPVALVVVGGLLFGVAFLARIRHEGKAQ